MRMRRLLLPLLAAVALAACASLPRTDPLQVTVAGLESLPGEGFELRMLVKLRVQNPNDTPLDYDGVYVRLDLLDKTFATGVTDASGTIPRYGEAVVAVPVTASALRLVRQALGFFGGEPPEKVTYELSGKIDRATSGAVRFRSYGEMDLRAAAGPAPAAGFATP